MLAPRRMFLAELPLFIENNSDNVHQIELRLMGRVIHVSRQSADTTQTSACQYVHKHQQQHEDVVTLVIDDGTASVDVVTASKDHFVEIGQLIDCIGHVRVVSDSQGPEAAEAATKQKRSYYLESKSISMINNPQEENLRQLELSTRNPELDNAQSTQFTSFQKIPQNRVLTSPHLEQKLNTLHHTMHPFPSIKLNSDATLRYIKYSANHGGLAINELESLVGATVNREKRAVRETVEELQRGGVVYMKEGKLFPM